MPTVPQRPLELGSAPIQIGYAPSAGHWYSIAQTLNWLHGGGGCCLPFSAVEWAISTSLQEFPIALRSRPATTHRLWIIYAVGTPPVREAEFTDFSGTTHTFQVAGTDIGRHTFFFLESCGAQDADMAAQAGTVGFQVISGGVLAIGGIACYDLPRGTLDEGYPDFGVNPPVGAEPIVDVEGRSAGGIVESAGYARRHAARTGLFTWLGDESSPETVSSGNVLWESDGLIMPRRVANATSSAVTVHIRARLASAGSATLAIESASQGDTDSTTVSSTVWAWYELSFGDIVNEDSTDEVDAGARDLEPFGDGFQVSNSSGTDLEIAAVIVTEAPVDAVDLWTPQRLGEDDVELWIDAEHLTSVGSGEVTAWTCPITGRTGSFNGGPDFDGPNTSYQDRSTVDFDDSVPENMNFGGGTQWDPTADGLTVYWVGEWDDASGADDYLVSFLEPGASVGWAIRSDSSGSGISAIAYDGSGTLQVANEGTSAPSGRAIARLSLSGNAGSLVLGMRVDRGTEVTVSFTGYSPAEPTSIDLNFFLRKTDAGNGKLASCFIVNRHIADGSDEDERIMAALEARFGV